MPKKSFEQTAKEICEELNFLEEQITRKAPGIDFMFLKTKKEFTQQEKEDFFITVLSVLNRITQHFKENNSQPKNILMKAFSSEPLVSSHITYLTQLSNGSIVTGDQNGKIKLFTVDYKTQSVTKSKEGHKHLSEITSLLQLSSEVLLSSSRDMSIYSWNLSGDTLSSIQKMKHSDCVYKIKLLSKDKFISCGGDHVMTIWNSSSFTKEQELQENNRVYNMIKLTNKDILISNCQNPHSLNFWNLKQGKKIYMMKNIFARSPDGLLELPNENIAVSHSEPPFQIKIIDPLRYACVTEIQDKSFDCYSSFCLLNKNNMIFVCSNGCVQINLDNYQIIKNYPCQKKLIGKYGIINNTKENCLIVVNEEQGISFIPL